MLGGALAGLCLGLSADTVPIRWAVDSSLDMSALREVILANSGPSVTVEVRRRGHASHRAFVLRKRVLKKKQSLTGESLARPDPGLPEAADLDETEVAETRRDSPKCGSRSSHRSSARQGPPISAPPPLPRSHELSNEGSFHMQAERGHKNRSIQHDTAAVSCGVPATYSSGFNASRCEKGQGWLSESPIGTTGSPSASSRSTWESQSGRDGACGDIDELEKGLTCSVVDLTAQREMAHALLVRVAAFKKKMSATARFFTLHESFFENP